MKRQRGQGEVFPSETTRFGDLATLNGFVRPAAVDKALKIQRKAAKKGEPLRIGEILVAGGEMTPTERDAILALQKRLRGDGETSPEEEGSGRVLLLEAGRIPRRHWRPVAAALAVGVLLVALAAVLAFAILR